MRGFRASTLHAGWLTFAIIFLFAPGTVGQIIPLYDQIPEPQEFPACDHPAPVAFAALPSPLENLHFLNGTLYLTAFHDGLYQAWPDGTYGHILAEDAPADATFFQQANAMMGLADLGGDLLVSQGQAVGQPTHARILRFHEPGSADYTVHAEGFEGANGMTSDAEGNVYLAHGFGEGIWKVHPDGSFEQWLDLPMANGVDLMPDGEHLVVAHVTDAGSSAFQVALADPSDVRTLFTFNVHRELDPAAPAAGNPVFPKLIDDLSVTPDGRVLATAHERLQTMIGDPTTGEACILMEHENSPTSVRVARDFGAWTGWAFITDLTGTVWAADIGLSLEGDAPALDEDGHKATPSIGIPLLVVASLGLARLRRRAFVA